MGWPDRATTRGHADASRTSPRAWPRLTTRPQTRRLSGGARHLGAARASRASRGRRTISAPASPKDSASSAIRRWRLRWLTLAAEAGDPVGQRNLAALYFKGEGVEQDHARAAELYRAAAEQGDGPAQDMLSWMLLEGERRPVRSRSRRGAGRSPPLSKASRRR